VNPSGEVVFAFDYYLGKLTADGSEQWRLRFFGGAGSSELESTYSAPLIDADGNIYLGLGTGKRWTRPWGKVVRSYTPSGALRWEFPVGEGVYTSSPALAPDGTLYIGSMDGSLYALRDDATPPNQIASLAITPSSVVGGGSAEGTVNLQSPAEAGGAEVAFVSAGIAAIFMPTSVVVPAGATTATFPIGTAVVTEATTVRMCGFYGGGTRCGDITVLPGILTPTQPAPTASRRKPRSRIH
jgi:outer membrane protein assembly factor BamB